MVPDFKLTHPSRHNVVSLIAAGALLIAASPVIAGPQTYLLDLPGGNRIGYKMEIEVTHSGRLEIDAQWTGGRILSFKLESPMQTASVLRRSGPSPQRFGMEVDPSMLGGGPWTLRVNSLSGRVDGEGRLTLQLPEPAPPPQPRKVARPPTPPPEPTEPWKLPIRAPAGLSGPRLKVVETTETFRAGLIEAERKGEIDNCRWQADLMRYLAEARDQAIRGAGTPANVTSELFRSITAAVDLVEELRNSENRLFVGPPPRDPQQRQIWLRERKDWLRRVERELDEILENVRRERIPELAHQTWPTRLASCVVASERHFEERGRLGVDRAAHRALAEVQWPHIRRAADALEALAPPR
ncbi:MAG: hypothetical protein GY716_03790 [bacterium]|nr:hypothetical protein [bacterium]